MKPKFSDAHRFKSGPYVPASEMSEGYLSRRFAEIKERLKAEAERERQEASWRLKNVIEAKKKAR